MAREAHRTYLDARLLASLAQFLILEKISLFLCRCDGRRRSVLAAGGVRGIASVPIVELRASSFQEILIGSVEEYRAHKIREGFFDEAMNEDDDFSDDDYTGLAEDA